MAQTTTPAEENRRQAPSVPWGAGREDDGPPLGTNPWARWAAICGMCGLAPLGVGFGVTALVQTLRSGQRGRNLAIFGVAVSLVWCVALAGVLNLAGKTVQRVGDGAVAHAQQASIEYVRVGDCFSWAEDGEAVENVVLEPCAAAHQGRVFARPQLGTMSAGDLRDAARQECTGAAKALPAGTRWGVFYPQQLTAPADLNWAICFTTG